MSQVFVPVPVGRHAHLEHRLLLLAPPTSRPFVDWNLTNTLEPEAPLIDAFQV